MTMCFNIKSYGWCMIVPAWLYESKIVILMVIWMFLGWHKDHNGYSYVLVQCLVVCLKEKYVVSCPGWLVSLAWCLYQSEYVISLLRMLMYLSLEFVNDMWPWVMLRGSFMWNLVHSGKVINIEVKSRNDILQVKEWWT